MDTFQTIVSIILMAVVVVDLVVAYLLGRGAVRSDFSILALNERAFVATMQAISGTMVGTLGANRVFSWHIPYEVVLVTFSFALIIQAIPGIVWLLLYLNHKFGKS